MNTSMSWTLWNNPSGAQWWERLKRSNFWEFRLSMFQRIHIRVSRFRTLRNYHSIQVFKFSKSNLPCKRVKIFIKSGSLSGVMYPSLMRRSMMTVILRDRGARMLRVQVKKLVRRCNSKSGQLTQRAIVLEFSFAHFLYNSGLIKQLWV